MKTRIPLERGISPQAAADPPGEKSEEAKDSGYDGEDRKRVPDRGVAPAYGHDVFDRAQEDVAERFRALVHDMGRSISAERIPFHPGNRY